MSAFLGVYDITLGGFILVALIAVAFLWLAGGDKSRVIRFGFFFEHTRTAEQEESPEDTPWPGEEVTKVK